VFLGGERCRTRVYSSFGIPRRWEGPPPNIFFFSSFLPPPPLPKAFLFANLCSSGRARLLPMVEQAFSFSFFQLGSVLVLAPYPAPAYVGVSRLSFRPLPCCLIPFFLFLPPVLEYSATFPFSDTAYGQNISKAVGTWFGRVLLPVTFSLFQFFFLPKNRRHNS